MHILDAYFYAYLCASCLMPRATQAGQLVERGVVDLGKRHDGNENECERHFRPIRVDSMA